MGGDPEKPVWVKKCCTSPEQQKSVRYCRDTFKRDPGFVGFDDALIRFENHDHDPGSIDEEYKRRQPSQNYKLQKTIFHQYLCGGAAVFHYKGLLHIAQKSHDNERYS